jgi:hypothetical protein
MVATHHFLVPPVDHLILLTTMLQGIFNQPLTR